MSISPALVLGNFSKHFELLRSFNSSFVGPYVNTEYYIGWLDHWGMHHSRVAARTAVNGLTQALKMRANVNMYMFFGGTNFGFTSGNTLQSVFPTSVFPTVCVSYSLCFLQSACHTVRVSYISCVL